MTSHTKDEREAPAGDSRPEPATAPKPASAPAQERRQLLPIDLAEAETEPDPIAENKTWEDFKRKHRLDYYVAKRRSSEKAPPRPHRPEAPVDPAVEQADQAEPAHATEGAETDPAQPTHKRTRRRRKAPTADAAPVTSTPSPSCGTVRDPYNDGMAVMSLWASFFAAAAGAYLWFHSSLVDGSSRSGWYLLGFGLAVLFTWLLGTITLQGKHPAHGSMHWLSPPIWALCGAPWPGLAAGLSCNMIAGAQGPWRTGFAVIGGLLAIGFAIWAMLRVGTRFTMDSPWPTPIDEDSEDNNSGWFAVKTLATIALNIYLWTLGSAMWSEARTAPPPPVSTLSAPLESLASAVSAVPEPSKLKSGPPMDKIKQALATIDAKPKPPAGNVAEARKLQQQAAPLYKKANWQAAYPLYQRAHEAASGLDDVAIQLGATEAALGKTADAIRHLDEGLSINPRNAAAWKILGDLELKGGAGSSASVERAVDYYLMSWWFAKDRKQALKAFDKMAERDSTYKDAVQRLKQKTGS